jgi:hypothetical protein
VLPSGIGISVGVDGPDAAEDDCWDILFFADVLVSHRDNGVVCAICVDEGHEVVFPDLEALWADHLFEPFVRWICEKLLPADRIALYSEIGHATWARLLRPEHDAGSAVAILPVRPA